MRTHFLTNNHPEATMPAAQKVTPIKGSSSKAKSAVKHDENRIVVMKHVKSTKGTHVYAADEDTADVVCTTVYLKKDALPEDPPRVIQLTVSF
jgi:hypothetical protein